MVWQFCFILFLCYLISLSKYLIFFHPIFVQSFSLPTGRTIHNSIFNWFLYSMNGCYRENLKLLTGQNFTDIQEQLKSSEFVQMDKIQFFEMRLLNSFYYFGEYIASVFSVDKIIFFLFIMLIFLPYLFSVFRFSLFFFFKLQSFPFNFKCFPHFLTKFAKILW